MAIGKGNISLQPIQLQTKMDAILVKQRPLPDDHPFYALIGRVTAEWARLEHTLDQIIWDLSEGSVEALSCTTVQIMSHYPRFKAIKSLARYRGHSDALISDVNKTAGDIQNLSDKRNRYIHDAWFLQTSGDQEGNINEIGQFKSLSAQNKKFGFHPISETEMTDFIRDIQEQAEKISELRQALQKKP